MATAKSGNPIKRVRDLSAVNELLCKFFGSEPHRVEVEYGKLRSRMIHYFAARRCRLPDELADEVIERALKQITAGAEIPDLTRYCYGIAHNLLSEQRKQKKEEPIVGDPVAPGWRSFGQPSIDERLLLLSECLAILSIRDRDLLKEYYWEDRKEMAKRLELTSNALRLRVFHAIEQIRLKVAARTSDATR